MWLIFFLALIFALILIIAKPVKRGSANRSQRGRIDFYSKGLDAGFSLSEINLLWAATSRVKMAHRTNIYGSAQELNEIINHIAGTTKFSDRKPGDPETVLLKKLFAFRNKMEMNRPRYRANIKSTRNIAVGQPLKIRVTGAGLFTSKVVENEADYLTITMPVGNPLLPVSWRDGKINIYFWRNDDGGYFFQSSILPRYYDRKNLHYRLHHSENLLRSQKRKSLRVSANIPSRLFMLKFLDESTQFLESAPGLRCIIKDLSDDGAAILIAGLKKKNQSIKIQFTLRSELIIITGLIKNVKYNEEKNLTTLNVEFLPPSDNVSMALLSYIFDIGNSRT